MGGWSETNGFVTEEILDELERCESLGDLKSGILPRLDQQQHRWAKKVEEILSTKKYTKKKFAELCDVTRLSVDKWCNGSIPKKREQFIKIGLAAGYDLEQMNHLLTRYGQYPGLYSKSLEDCIAIFVINQKYGEEALEKYQYILDELKKKFDPVNDEDSEDVSTARFDEKLSKVQDKDDLESFIAENLTIFSRAYHNFYAFVMSFFYSNEKLYASNINELAMGQEWSSSLRSCVSAIRQKKWIPTRNKVISLGLHLGLDRDGINDMLSYAHMEPLYSRNLFESVIIYILENASLNLIPDCGAEVDDADYLLIYTRAVLKQLDILEVNQFISELPKNEDEEE